jgi:hypothetical protein
MTATINLAAILILIGVGILIGAAGAMAWRKEKDND